MSLSGSVAMETERLILRDFTPDDLPAYVVLVMAGNTLRTYNSPGPDPAHPSGVQDIASLHWLAGSTSGQAGVTLELLSFAALALFVVGWILQFVGHAIEGNRPAFFRNPVYLLVGPLWLVRRALTTIGLSKPPTDASKRTP